MDIAIVRRNGLGDLICAFPLILFLQEKHPDARITLFVDQRNFPLIPYLPAVDTVVVFPAKGFKYWHLLRTAWRYRKRFDLAISAKTSPMKLTNFFLWGLQAKERVAYVDSSWHAKMINRPIPYKSVDAKRAHQALKSLKLVAPHFHVVPEQFYPKISIPSAVKGKYSVQKSGKPTLLLTATTTKSTSRLDSQRYATLANQLHTCSPISVRIIAQKEDRLRAEEIASHLQIDHQIYFPRNFDEFMVLLDSSDLFFVGDGGVAHIGAAMEKPQVVLFGQTSPVEWHPLGQQTEVFFNSEHVDRLCDKEILEALKLKLREVIGRGRDNL